jgi:hypothetical protein
VLRERADASLDEQLRYAWRVCRARTPDDPELAVLRTLYTAQISAEEANPGAAKKLCDQSGGPTESS